MFDARWRKPTDRELALVKKLLGVVFPGRAELLAQFLTGMVQPIDEEGSLAVSAEADAPRALGSPNCPVVGQTLDQDNIPIEIFVHVVDGYLNEIEVVKLSAQGIFRPPTAERLTVQKRR